MAVSSNVEVKAALPVVPGASAVNTTWMFVRLVVTFVPSVTVITWPEIETQYSPAPTVGQDPPKDWPVPPTDTPVTAKVE